MEKINNLVLKGDFEQANTGILPTGSEKRNFSYLDDGITNRKYVVASIELFNGRQSKFWK
ncbi:hypothetical protein [Bacillus cereus]|uniref:hypothetical protein n=1 Tax=Bacillus cereus TaxID=1396 RepID=UPI00211D879A|nr:hypothetical protein [Bacillus cereus]